MATAHGQFSEAVFTQAASGRWRQGHASSYSGAAAGWEEDSHASRGAEWRGNKGWHRQSGHSDYGLGGNTAGCRRQAPAHQRASFAAPARRGPASRVSDWRDHQGAGGVQAMGGSFAATVPSTVRLRLQLVETGSGSASQLEVTPERSSTIRALKMRHFAAELAAGSRIRCMFLGRQLNDEETLKYIAEGAVLQCYVLHPTEGSTMGSADSNMAGGTSEGGRAGSLGDGTAQAHSSVAEGASSDDVNELPEMSLGALCKEAAMLAGDVRATLFGTTSPAMLVFVFLLFCLWLGYAARPGYFGGTGLSLLCVLSLAWPVFLYAVQLC